MCTSTPNSSRAKSRMMRVTHFEKPDLHIGFPRLFRNMKLEVVAEP